MDSQVHICLGISWHFLEMSQKLTGQGWETFFWHSGGSSVQLKGTSDCFYSLTIIHHQFDLTSFCQYSLCFIIALRRKLPVKLVEEFSDSIHDTMNSPQESACYRVKHLFQKNANESGSTAFQTFRILNGISMCTKNMFTNWNKLLCNPPCKIVK